MKPTKLQFEEYVSIRDSGITNMWNISFIEAISMTGLNKDICLYIMRNFADLAEEYEVSI